MSTPLTVRRLLIDLETPFAVRWLGNDPFQSALFNALSMSFPAGEQNFIDAVRTAHKLLPQHEQEKFTRLVQDFIGQEATHRRIHDLFNKNLERQGQKNNIDGRILKRKAEVRYMHPVIHLASTAAVEHLTAIFAEYLFTSDVLDGAPEHLKTLWHWHAAEEAEHRSVAFDLLKTLDPNLKMRNKVFKWTTFDLIKMITRQTLENLWHDKSLFTFNTVTGLYRLFFSKKGLIRRHAKQWRAYLHPDFHPNQGDDQHALEWLSNNSEAYKVVSSQTANSSGV